MNISISNEYNKRTIKRLLSRSKIVDNGYITPCLEWQGSINKHGYGETSYLDVTVRVHVLFYKLNNSDAFNSKLQVLHKCDIRNCFNLDHLFQGSQSTNMKDCVSKGKHNQTRKTHCLQGHEYNSENTYIRKGNKRDCKICRKGAVKRYGIRIK